MYINITIFLLYNFLVANRVLSALPKSVSEAVDDDILETSFDDCRKWLKKPLDSTILVSEFFSYFDDGSGCQQIVDATIEYLNETQAGGTHQYKIDLRLYKELLKAISKFSGLPIDYFAKIRKEPSDDEILETSFDDCRKWLKKPSEPTISVLEFLSYAGKYHQTINSTINYLKQRRPGAIDKIKIDLGLYKKLIRAICKGNGLSIEFFTRIRKEASDEKILETSFYTCREWLKKPFEPTITFSEFLSYVDECVSGCQKIKDSAILYLNETQTGAAKQNKIDLGLYKKLLKAICKVNGLPLAYFGEIKKQPSDDKADAPSELAPKSAEDDILETSFDDCRKWLKKSSEATISVFEFLSYVGNCDQNVNSTVKYLRDTRPGALNKKKIDLGLYKELIRAICQVKGLSIVDFTKISKDASEVKKRKRAALVYPE